MAADHLTGADRKQSEAALDGPPPVRSAQRHRKPRPITASDATSTNGVSPAKRPAARAQRPRRHTDTRHAHQGPAQEAAPVAHPDRTPRPTRRSNPQPRTPPRSSAASCRRSRMIARRSCVVTAKRRLRRQPCAPPGSVERDTAKPGEPKHRRQRSDAKTHGGKTDRVTGAMHWPERKLSEHARRRAHPPAG